MSLRFDDRLRGATLDRVTVNWRDGTALVTFFPSPGSPEGTMHMCTLRAEGVVRVSMERGASGVRVERAVVRAVVHTPGKAGGPASVQVTTEDGESVTVDAGLFEVDPTS